MTLATDFERLPFFAMLGKRKDGFRKIVNHVEQNSLDVIVETGCARPASNFLGDGKSTVIWDWLALRKPGIEAYSCDLDPIAVDSARRFCSRVKIECSDSLPFLRAVPDVVASRISVLYLDSFDWSPEDAESSAEHHLLELVAIWARLPSGCLVVVDDRHSEYNGKHTHVQTFMRAHQIEPAFEGYQIGWIKP